MKTFSRILGYSLQYKWRFFPGVFVAFFVAVLNGLSLTAFVPLFEALGDKKKHFEIQFSTSEREIFTKVLAKAGEDYKAGRKVRSDGKDSDELLTRKIPKAPKKIDGELALFLQNVLNDQERDHGLSRFENLRLNQVMFRKLELNSAKKKPTTIVLYACLAVIPLYLLKLVLLLISVRLIAGTGYQAVRDLRRDLYSAAQRLPLTYFYREKTGLLMSRLINDVEIIAAVISSNLRDAITNIFFIVTHVGLLAYLNYKLLFISVLAVPLILSPITLFSRKIRKSTTRSQELLADLNANVLESVSGVRVIRAFGMESHETQRFGQVNDKLFWRMFKQQFYLKVGPYMIEFFSVVVAVGIIALGSFFVDGVNFTHGDFMAFLITLMFIIRPIIQLSSMYSKIISANAAGTRVFDIMDRKPDITEPETSRELTSLSKEIHFKNINFTYPETDKAVLRNVDLKVPRGSTTALVGESGGGKSTLMDLMSRFFDPNEGEVLVDGFSIRDFRIKDHRSRIGIVTQDIFLFYGTILENIAYGDANYNQKDVERAARLANAHDFIMQQPRGYDTLVGERGVTLSGGQRQRIAIARALLRDPEILILDEATSALDTESERLVQQALERLFLNRTTFVIAHRLSTIEKADSIVVISEGQIQEQGTHAELMERKGVYAHLQKVGRQSIPGKET